MSNRTPFPWDVRIMLIWPHSCTERDTINARSPSWSRRSTREPIYAADEDIEQLSSNRQLKKFRVVLLRRSEDECLVHFQIHVSVKSWMKPEAVLSSSASCKGSNS